MASLPIAEVYIDESSQQHRYLVLGGVIAPRDDTAEIIKAIWAARAPELPSGEMKWAKVSRSKLGAYKRVLDTFFDHKGGTFDFHSVVIDTTQQKHALYNQGDREIGFNKEIFLLAMKFGRLYECVYHIYPDYRDTNQRPEDLRLILNRAIAKKGDKRDWPFRRVQFRDSKKTELLQIADMFSGAIAYHLNGHHQLDGASPAKIELSNHIFARANVRNVRNDTAIRGKFTIWHRMLR